MSREKKATLYLHALDRGEAAIKVARIHGVRFWELCRGYLAANDWSVPTDNIIELLAGSLDVCEVVLDAFVVCNVFTKVHIWHEVIGIEGNAAESGDEYLVGCCIEEGGLALLAVSGVATDSFVTSTIAWL